MQTEHYPQVLRRNARALGCLAMLLCLLATPALVQAQNPPPDSTETDTTETEGCCIVVDVVEVPYRAAGYEDVRLYPIPADGVTTLYRPWNMTFSSVELVDMQGRICHRFDPATPDLVVKHLPPGLYFVSVDRGQALFKLLIRR